MNNINNNNNYEQPSYYSVIPANVRYDKNLKANEKLLYSEITCLANKNGYCYATNEYFAKLYNVGKNVVSGWISNLAKRGYVITQIIYKQGTKEIEKRLISIHSTVATPITEKGNTCYENNIYHITEKSNTPITENRIDNITSNEYYKKEYKNISSNEDIKNDKSLNFKIPTSEEVQSYCDERKNNINANAFIDYYQSKGWLVGKSKMKDWKACIRTWENNNKESNQNNNKNKTETEKNEDNDYYSPPPRPNCGFYDEMFDEEIKRMKNAGK